MSTEPVTLKANTVTDAVSEILSDLEANAPTSLTEARLKLTDLFATVRCSIEDSWARIKPYDNQPADARAAMPDYQAVLSDVSIRVEAVEALVIAITDLTKAEAAAAAALDRAMKKLHAPRVEARVWQKLRLPFATPGSETRPVYTMGVDVGTGTLI